MLTLDKNYWNNRYKNNETGWDIGYISTPLKSYFDQLQNKDLRILIPGCGNAYEAEYLHQQGFKNVFLIDIAPEAIFKFSQRVPDFPQEHLIVGDFFEHKGKYDLIIEQTFFCAIIPDLREKYVQKTADLLDKSGRLVGLLFDCELNADKPPFTGYKKDYIPLFQKYFLLHTFETAYNSIEPRAGRELFINVLKK
jgi:methyl halide transferase